MPKTQEDQSRILRLASTNDDDGDDDDDDDDDYFPQPCPCEVFHVR